MAGMVADQPRAAQAAELLAWYDRHRRVLPWRALPGEAADPYRVWLSEIMLQQTTVQAVKPYFEAFTRRFPTVADLAASPSEEIMRLWAGLGYYSRARNLHACAKAVVAEHAGVFPADEAALLRLPGVGPYTAAAIASIAFGIRAVVVDGNVERVIARLHAVDAPLPGAKPEIRRLADALTPDARPGDFAQAMMDLGATICSPKRPICGVCPFLGSCAAQKAGMQEAYPLKAPKGGRPTRRGAAFVAIRADGAVLVRTRPPKGLLGGMLEVPTTDWVVNGVIPRDGVGAPLPGAWRGAGTIRHVFTHFPLELAVYAARMPMAVAAPPGSQWLPAGDIPAAAFPTLFRKVLAAAGAG
jgi:A/G-specific adenine glycosylase